MVRDIATPKTNQWQDPNVDLPRNPSKVPPIRTPPSARNTSPETHLWLSSGVTRSPDAFASANSCRPTFARSLPASDSSDTGTGATSTFSPNPAPKEPASSDLVSDVRSCAREDIRASAKVNGDRCKRGRQVRGPSADPRALPPAIYLPRPIGGRRARRSQPRQKHGRPRGELLSGTPSRPLIAGRGKRREARASDRRGPAGG